MAGRSSSAGGGRLPSRYPLTRTNLSISRPSICRLAGIQQRAFDNPKLHNVCTRRAGSNRDGNRGEDAYCGLAGRLAQAALPPLSGFEIGLSNPPGLNAAPFARRRGSVRSVKCTRCRWFDRGFSHKRRNLDLRRAGFVSVLCRESCSFTWAAGLLGRCSPGSNLRIGL